MSRQETILPPPSTPAGHQAKRVIIIALLRGAAASAYYVFMAERPAEARLQQEQRLEGSSSRWWDSPGKPLQLADDFPKQTCDTGPALTVLTTKNFSVSVGASPSLDLGGKEGKLKEKSLLGQSAATVFDRLLAVRPGKDDNGVELGIIQLVHCVWSNVEQSMATPATDIG